MGLSASQARMLQLTARRSDIEYQMQQIASARLDLTNQMTQISQNYNDGLNDRILYYRENASSDKAQLNHLQLIKRGYQVYDTKAGEIVNPILDADLSNFNFDTVSKTSALATILGESINNKALYVVDEAGNKTGFTQENLDKAGFSVRITDAGKTAGKTEIKDEDLEAGIRDGSYTLVNKENNQDVNYKSVSNIVDYSNIMANLTVKNGEYYIMSADGQSKVQVIFDGKNEDGSYKDEAYDEKENILYLRSDKLDSTGLLTPENLETGLREGRYQLVVVAADGTMNNQDWTTASFILDELDTSNDGAAQATYDVESAEAQSKDKTLELKLKNLENEHKAVETEIESVQKVITKNIEGSFKTFV